MTLYICFILCPFLFMQTTVLCSRTTRLSFAKNLLGFAVRAMRVPTITTAKTADGALISTNTGLNNKKT